MLDGQLKSNGFIDETTGKPMAFVDCGGDYPTIKLYITYQCEDLSLTPENIFHDLQSVKVLWNKLAGDISQETAWIIGFPGNVKKSCVPGGCYLSGSRFGYNSGIYVYGGTFAPFPPVMNVLATPVHKLDINQGRGRTVKIPRVGVGSGPIDIHPEYQETTTLLELPIGIYKMYSQYIWKLYSDLTLSGISSDNLYIPDSEDFYYYFPVGGRDAWIETRRKSMLSDINQNSIYFPEYFVNDMSQYPWVDEVEDPTNYALFPVYRISGLCVLPNTKVYRTIGHPMKSGSKILNYMVRYYLRYFDRPKEYYIHDLDQSIYKFRGPMIMNNEAWDIITFYSDGVHNPPDYRGFGTGSKEYVQQYFYPPDNYVSRIFGDVLWDTQNMIDIDMEASTRYINVESGISYGVDNYILHDFLTCSVTEKFDGYLCSDEIVPYFGTENYLIVAPDYENLGIAF